MSMSMSYQKEKYLSVPSERNASVEVVDDAVKE